MTSRGEARYATDIVSGRVFELNGPAALLLEQGRGGVRPEVAASALAAAYPGLSREDAAADTRRTLDAFVAAGLMRVSATTP